ncbi:indolepyruvate ferredoxin oxidoreductase subunit alpha [Ruminococcus champanellensis]|uniref:indolepyruvate ferredoxin oxidoreductase subunit alpha n=1 Tax=Ruminococcus champanellensis TaxID=1161942 RepID=UPI00248B719F|nr:indolepyruvate ferredoxin oxidoreductase subunit alpha [Ruminococcus champanellensis]
MSKTFLMGNAAIAMGALHAGVNLVAGYPGTPSTEILETVAKCNDGSVYVEWSVNEKAALEVAAGASYAGARTLVTMKQVGLNVASDPLMSLAYVGVKGGMVIVSADDPGPISSQTEQDTRHFAQFAKLPVFDPSTPEEAYEMIQDAFAYSEKYGTPVLFRPTTRVCHSCADIQLHETPTVHKPEGFVKDTMRWVIFPRTSYLNHIKLEERTPVLSKDFSAYRFNQLTGSGKLGIVTSGISYTYLQEALEDYTGQVKVLKIATANPFPEELALQFLEGLEQVLAIEELDPVLERALTYLCGKHHLPVQIHGKLDGMVQPAGENSVESVHKVLEGYLGLDAIPAVQLPEPPQMPVRPPVLCAGCPHRASFYAVKQAMKGRKAVFSGDIGCYTLGNAMPLDMVDTCLCMGADVTMAQGLHRIEPDTVNFSFIGDSTFFASGMTGIVNAVYNQTDIILVVLDNSTTAMTGHQPHPGTGMTMMHEISPRVSIEAILRAVGLTSVETVDPLNLEQTIQAVRKAADKPGVKAIICKSPCIAVSKPAKRLQVDESRCVGCKQCIRELGCPAISLKGQKAYIEPDLCFGCTICAQVCKPGAIREEDAQ